MAAYGDTDEDTTEANTDEDATETNTKVSQENAEDIKAVVEDMLASSPIR